MNPQNNELPSIHMPQTQTPSAGGVPQHDPLVQPDPQVVAPTNPVSPMPASATSVAQPLPVTPLANTSPMPMPTIADDADLIERDWVIKAKQIVEETKTDPHAQNREMNRMKADYMKKRYNKDVKLEGS